MKESHVTVLQTNKPFSACAVSMSQNKDVLSLGYVAHHAGRMVQETFNISRHKLSTCSYEWFEALAIKTGNKLKHKVGK